ncbi:MAG: GTP cyclohydrolase II, partial [Boseongicola sp.]
MTLLPTLNDQIARARTDLRLGLPVVLQDDGHLALIFAAEGLTDARLGAARKLGIPVLAITAWRAETLRAQVYDGDLARLALPDDANASWIASIADPTDDLSTPMKGPFNALRDGSADAHRLAIRLVKSAWLLPAALVIEVQTAPPQLTVLDATAASRALAAPVMHR